MSIRFRLIKAVLVIVAFSGLLFTGPVQAKMYKWTDENGKVHYTDSISKIPKKYRKSGEGGMETMRSAPGSSSSGGSSGASSYSLGPPQEDIEVPLIALGNGNYALDVVLNNNVRLQLMLDTGASMVVLHPSVAPQLGIRNLEDQPKIVVSTAGGKELNPLGILNTVQVGQVKLPDIEATFNTHMPPTGGLLGMTFLNEFRFEIDRQQSLLILRPLRAGNEPMYGGRPLAWWRDHYKQYLSGLNQAGFMKSSTQNRQKRMEHQRMALYYQELVDRLDRRAQSANVPREIRDPFGNRAN